MLYLVTHFRVTIPTKSKKGARMSQMITKRLMILPIAVFSVLSATAVTFSVDLSDQSTISENGVHIAGALQDYDSDGNLENPDLVNWDPSVIELTDTDGDSIFEVTLEMVAGSFEYKFINGNSWGADSDDEWAGEAYEGGESCRADGGNRTLTIPEDTESLDVGTVCWESCIACSEVHVTFRVDMANETVDAAGVSIAGSMNDWSAGANLMTLESDTSTVYSTTLLLTTGDAHYYKFVNGQSWESGTNLADCGSGDGYGGFNRTHTVGASDETLAAVCYTACTTCSGEEPVTASVTFQANMSTLLSYGFSDDVHTLNMMGDPNGWTPGDVFLPDLVDPELYTVTVEHTEYPGNTINWKFKALPEDSWNNSGWEVSDNRNFTWTGENITLDPLTPNILPTGELQNDVTVEVHVTWNEGTLNYNNGLPFPVEPDTIIMNGSFMNGWHAWGNCMGPNCDSPTGPTNFRLTDEDGDGIYIGSKVLLSGAANVFTYKFGAYYPGIDTVSGSNGAMDNEAGGGSDYVAYIPSATSGVFQIEGVFGNNNSDNPWLSIIGDKDMIANEFALHGNYPNPFNPSTAIRFNVDIQSHVSVKVFNLVGKEVRTLQNNALNSGFYSVTWNGKDNYGKDVPSGMYLYNIESNGRILSGKMLLLK